MSIAELFVASSVSRLQEEYLPRIHSAVEILDSDEIWWRPRDCTNSVGNLLAHLSGNVRQWIISGLGGVDDDRNRAREFAQPDEDGEDRNSLLARLDATVEDACEVISGLDVESLEGLHSIQGGRTTGLEAVYHVVEHFGWHVGQIVYIAKLKSSQGAQLKFYDDETINQLRNS